MQGKSDNNSSQMLGNVSAMLEDQETKPTNETRKEAKKCFADESEEHHALEP